MISVFASLVLGGLEFFQRRNQRDINMDQPLVRQRDMRDAPRRRHVQEIGMRNFDGLSAGSVNPKRDEWLRVPGLSEFLNGHAAQLARNTAAAQVS